jgi:hypothetical protein
MTDDTIKCALNPLVRSAYLPVTFTDAQWEELVKAYPQGVCDYSKPGVDRVPTQPWQTYQDRNGNVIYGGRPLGEAPVSGPLNPLGLPSAVPCQRRRRWSLRLHAQRGQRIVSATVYINGKLVKRFHGRPLRRIVLTLPRRGTFTLKIVTRTNTGARVISVRSYRGCAKSKARNRGRSRRAGRR